MSKNCVIFSKNEAFIQKITVDILKTNGFKSIVQLYADRPMLGISGNAFHISDIHSDAFSRAINKTCVDDILLVIIGADKIYKRHDSAFAKIQHLIKAGGKIIVQHLPYMVDAWKIYYPYSCIDKRLLKYPHSYAFEQDCQNYFNEMRESDPCAIDRITENICDITAIDYEHYFEEMPVFNTVQTSDDIKQEYSDLKESLFATDGIGISQIQKKLYKLAQSSVFGHNLPIDLKNIYSNTGHIFTCSDLPIDTWISSEIRRIVNHTNELTEVLYGKSLYK